MYQEIERLFNQTLDRLYASRVSECYVSVKPTVKLFLKNFVIHILHCLAYTEGVIVLIEIWLLIITLELNDHFIELCL